MECAIQPRPRAERRLSMPMMGGNRNLNTVAPSQPRVSRRSSISGFGFGKSDNCSSPVQEKYLALDPEPEPTFTQAELDQKMRVIMRDKELWGEFKQKLAQSDSKAGLGLQIVMRNFLIDYESRIMEIEAEQDDTQSAVTLSSHSRAGLLKKPPRGNRTSFSSSGSSSFFQRALSSLGGDSWQLEEELSEKDFGSSYNMIASNRQIFDQPMNINIHNANSELDMDVSSTSARSMDLSDIAPGAQPKTTQANIQSKSRGGDNPPSYAGKSIFRGASAIGNMFTFKRLEEELTHSAQNSDSSLNVSSGGLNYQMTSSHAICIRSASPSQERRVQVQGEEDNNENIRVAKIVTPPPCEDDNSDDNEDNKRAVWLGWNSRKT